MNSSLPSSSSAFVASNSMAVRLMEKGRHEEAYHLLKTSVSRLQSKISASRRLKCGSLTSFYDTLAEERIVSGMDTATRLLSVPVYIGKARYAFLQTQQNIFSVYTKAFEIQTDEDKDEEPSLFSIFIVLSYNMGLALFIGSTMAGLQVHPNQIQHNIRVFEASMRAMSGISVMDQQQQDSGLLNVFLALTFNLGYLHQLNFSFQETREHLSLALNLVTCPRAEESLSEADYDFFYSSMCMFADRGMELHLAPAA